MPSLAPSIEERLQALCQLVKETSLCGLGQSAPNPVLSTLRYFPHEYEELLTDRNKDAPGGSQPGEHVSA